MDFVNNEVIDDVEEVADVPGYTGDDDADEEINMEGYDPNVDDGEEEEFDELETEEIGTFKIDENMPEELKQQLIKFNEKTEKLNSINNGTDPEIAELGIDNSRVVSTDDDDEEEYEDASVEAGGNDTIVEEDTVVDVGSLF